MAEPISSETGGAFLALARDAVATWLAGTGRPPRPAIDDPALDEPGGAFVTWRKADGGLRGCIGRMESDAPRWETVADVARLAASDDPRFSPVAWGEFADLAAEVSLLSIIEPCPDAQLIEVGTHGVVLRARGRSGVFLPEVPTDFGWDREEFLEQLCRKAGLPAGTWRNAKATLEWFTSQHIAGTHQD